MTTVRPVRLGDGETGLRPRYAPVLGYRIIDCARAASVAAASR